MILFEIDRSLDLVQEEETGVLVVEGAHMIDAKVAEQRGSLIGHKVDRFFASSKTCSDCGHINRDLELSDRQWVCQGCGAIHRRDFNRVWREYFRDVT